MAHIASSRAPLTNSAPTAHYLRLERHEEAAIVGVRLRFSELSGDEVCSGILVSEHLVLTAAHCLHTLVPRAVTIFFEVDGQVISRAAQVSMVHPDLDVMLLQVLDGETPSVRPIPIAGTVPTALEVGGVVQLAGFGEGSDGSERAFLVAEIQALEERDIRMVWRGLASVIREAHC